MHCTILQSRVPRFYSGTVWVWHCTTAHECVRTSMCVHVCYHGYVYDMYMICMGIVCVRVCKCVCVCVCARTHFTLYHTTEFSWQHVIIIMSESWNSLPDFQYHVCKKISCKASWLVKLVRFDVVFFLDWEFWSLFFGYIMSSLNKTWIHSFFLFHNALMK